DDDCRERPRARVREAVLDTRERQRKHDYVKSGSPRGDRQAEERRPTAELHRLATAGAACQRADDADLVEREIQRDEQTDERDERRQHATRHFVLVFAELALVACLVPTGIAAGFAVWCASTSSTW